mgnify:FL=1
MTHMRKSKFTPDLFNWQWTQYPASHTVRANLMIHALTFVWVGGGVVLAGLGALSQQWSWLGMGLTLYGAAILAQELGHSFEEKRQAPFLSPLDFFARFTAENLVTFPRFLLSGAFAATWRSKG